MVRRSSPVRVNPHPAKRARQAFGLASIATYAGVTLSIRSASQAEFADFEGTPALDAAQPSATQASTTQPSELAFVLEGSATPALSRPNSTTSLATVPLDRKLPQTTVDWAARRASSTTTSAAPRQAAPETTTPPSTIPVTQGSTPDPAPKPTIPPVVEPTTTPPVSSATTTTTLVNPDDGPPPSTSTTIESGAS